jgi:hypothetical protein
VTNFCVPGGPFAHLVGAARRTFEIEPDPHARSQQPDNLQKYKSHSSKGFDTPESKDVTERPDHAQTHDQSIKIEFLTRLVFGEIGSFRTPGARPSRTPLSRDGVGGRWAWCCRWRAVRGFGYQYLLRDNRCATGQRVTGTSLASSHTGSGYPPGRWHRTVLPGPEQTLEAPHPPVQELGSNQLSPEDQMRVLYRSGRGPLTNAVLGTATERISR